MEGKENNKNNETQRRLLSMLAWFHEFCVKNEIRYYIVGGTMLGAARHKGFIPWDDDIDVGIPRKDYEKLLQHKQKLIPSNCKYQIESYLDGNRDFEYIFAKLYDVTTTLVENRRKHPKRGLYIDVFPLDGIGEDREDAIKNYKIIKWKLNLHAVTTCEIRKGRDWLKNFAVLLAHMIPDCLLFNHKLIASINKECKKRDFDTQKYVGNLVGNWREKEIMPREFFGTPTIYEFENLHVYGVQDYDNYLESLYHNWRQLPPEEKRKSEHDYLSIDLDSPYK